MREAWKRETYVRSKSFSSESAVKYLHVGRRKIQISPPPGEQDKSNALPQGQQRQSNPHPMPCSPPRLYIDRYIIPSSKTTYKAAAFSHKEYNSRNIFVIKQLGYYGKVPIPLKISCMPSVLKKLENRFFKSHRYLVLVICNFKLY